MGDAGDTLTAFRKVEVKVEHAAPASILELGPRPFLDAELGLPEPLADFVDRQTDQVGPFRSRRFGRNRRRRNRRRRPHASGHGQRQDEGEAAHGAL